MCVALVRAHRDLDCYALEVNPIVLTTAGGLICADCKMQIDNAAAYRHPEMGIEVARDFGHQPTPLDLVGWGIEKADLRGSGFVMDMGHDGVSPGAIGFHPIGGGSAMMAMDALSRIGLTPANYADTSGNPVASKIYRVAKVVLSQPGIQGYLLGGFMMANQEQWHHAHAVVKALREVLPGRPGFPCVLLVCGNKEEESLAILREGLADCARSDPVEIYGRDHVTDTLFIAGQDAAPWSRSTRRSWREATMLTFAERTIDGRRRHGRLPGLRVQSVRRRLREVQPRHASARGRRAVGGAPLRRARCAGRGRSAWRASTRVGCGARAPIESIDGHARRGAGRLPDRAGVSDGYPHRREHQRSSCRASPAARGRCGRGT